MLYKKVDTYQYFYKNNECSAPSAEDKSCICWHDEGTGPYAQVKLDHRADGVLPANFNGKGLLWRIRSDFVPVVSKVSEPEAKNQADLRAELSARCAGLISDLLETTKRTDLSAEDAQGIAQIRLGLYILERGSLRSK